MIKQKYERKTVRLVDENKEVEKITWTGPKTSNMKGKINEFYYLEILFH